MQIYFKNINKSLGDFFFFLICNLCIVSMYRDLVSVIVSLTQLIETIHKISNYLQYQMSHFLQEIQVHFRWFDANIDING